MISPSYSPIIFRVERFAPSPIGHILPIGPIGAAYWTYWAYLAYIAYPA